MPGLIVWAAVCGKLYSAEPAVILAAVSEAFVLQNGQLPLSAKTLLAGCLPSSQRFLLPGIAGIRRGGLNTGDRSGIASARFRPRLMLVPTSLG